MVVDFLVSYTSLTTNSDFVPISLLVTLEIVKFIQATFIGWDATIYDEEKDMPTKAQSSNLNEELGQVEYIFTDKTGTLTQNIMEFKKMCIGTTSYGKGDEETSKDKNSETSKDQDSGHDSDEEMKKSGSSSQKNEDSDITNVNFNDPEFYEHFEDKNHENYEMINKFMLHLALCHTVIIEKKEKDGKERISYSAR